MTRAEFVAAGQALFGESWIGPLASASGIERRSIARMASGAIDVPADLAEPLSRAALLIGDLRAVIDRHALVEMDEAYVGGKPRRSNRKDDNDPKPRGRGTSKTPIVGAVERGGRVKAKMVAHDEMTADDMEAFTRETVDLPRALVTTDEYNGYGRLNNIVAHRVINHSVAYVDWDMFAGQFGPTHTNTIESFWALVKRAIIGQFHHVSRTYLPLYLRELAYRYNLRNGGCDLDGVLHLAVKP